MVWTYTIIFLLAAIPFFEVAIILLFAIIGGIPAILFIIIVFLGNLLTIILLIVFIDYVRNWRKKKKRKDKNKRSKKIWDKYGLPGLAFIGPFFIGTHLTALLAISFGGTRDRKSRRLNSSH